MPSRLATASHAERGKPRVRVEGSWVARFPALLPIGFFILTLLLIAVHQGKIAELFYPAGALVIAVMFYRFSPPHYLGFVCWLFFLSPEVRRLADFVNGAFNDKSPIMVAPLLAVSLCGLSFIKHANGLGQRRNAPLVLIVVAMLYAFVVGVIQAGFAPALYTLVNWAFPALVAFYLNVTWRHYPDYQRVLMSTVLYAGLLMGIYGVIQFVVVPPWDAFWIIQIKGWTFGHPVPYGLRVWSTMNAPGIFAVAIMYMVLMSLASRKRLAILMALAGVAALLFTSVRTCWGGLVIGLVYPLAMLDGRSRRRMIGGVLGIVMLCAPLMMFDQISDGVLGRMSTLTDISNDSSFRERTYFYEIFLTTALSDISGEGLGSIGLGAKLATDSTAPAGGGFDSGVMEIPFVMGWPGTLLFMTGIVLLMWRAFKASRRQPKDRFVICGVGVSVAIFAMLLMFNTMTSGTGMLFYVGVTMPVIGLRYALYSAHEAHAAKAAAKAASVASAPAGRAVAPAAVLRAGRGPAPGVSV
ncbi:hypothetical protein B0G77_4030 [Paraburkholderia sp. BL10I2N1]|nr:hypothetical protein B0G77_4030 [Paraburkholderia sp. BL10I2N1]